MVLHSAARRAKRCVCCVHRYYGLQKIRIKRKINSGIRYEPVCRQALVGVLVAGLSSVLSPPAWLPFTLCHRVYVHEYYFSSLFSEAVTHNAHFLSYVALVTSVCRLKAVMDAAWVQCWSVHLQPGHLICPITVSKEDFATLRRSALLEKRALSKRITFSDWIIQWGLGPGRGAIKQQITLFLEGEMKTRF